MERKDSKKLVRTASSTRYVGSTMPVDLLAGTDIWISDANSVWIEANVIEQKENILVIRKRDAEMDTEIDINFEEIHKLNPRIVSDMSGLNFIHEPGILSNLTFRALSKMPYTYMGTVLIAMNPLQKIESPSIAQFVNKPLDHETPHPYALAELAYQQLCFSDTNQCLVVSGESGAGKTETAKILLKFLAERTPHTSSSSAAAASVAQDIDKRMLQSSPLLESFGNAKTGRNNNSSRFGKLMKIFYKPNDVSKKTLIGSANLDRMTLAGVAIETYLLEKSRVISQSAGERNFHVFYQLLSSLDVADDRFTSFHEQVKLVNDATAYRLLSQSNCSVIEGGDDYADFESTYNSFLAYDFEAEEIIGIFSILAGLLHLSNLTFKEVETDAGVKAEVEDEAALELAAETLGVESSSLAQLLTSRSMDVAGSNGTKVVLRLEVKEAVYARDASIKAIYENLFSMIVSRLNESLSNGQGNLRKNTDLSFIGILDIYGFETFETNSFDQFLINYANESLQNTFNMQIFQSELKLFAEENISCHITEMPENYECISLIAAKTNSVFSILDSICQLRTNRTDERFVDELHKQLSKNRYFLPVHAKERRDTFCVKHFAGKIKYTVGVPAGRTDGESYTWVSKNNDSSPDELKTLCEGSGLAEVRRLYDHYSKDNSEDFRNSKRISRRRKSLKPSTDALKEALEASAEGQSPEPTSSPRLDQKNQLIRSTVASAFSHSMFQLSTLLVASNCLFIRCIKPNTYMEVDVMDNEFIVNQLRSLGVLQTCEVLKLGMPTRLPYKELIDALGPLIQKLPPNLVKNTEDITLIACILWAFDVKRDLYKLGRTRVFFRAGQFEKIEQILQSTKEGVGARGDELVRRIIESSTFKTKADKLAAELVSTIKDKQEDIEKTRTQVAEALKLISVAPVKEVEVPADLVELQSSIDTIASTAKQTMEQAFIRLNATVAICNKARDALGTPVIAEVDNLSGKLDTLNGRVSKLGAKHTRTVTRLDALMGRNDRVRTVANSLDDTLNSTQELLQNCNAYVDEVRDGGMRCDLPYAEERAQVCEDAIQQVSFRLEGVELDLKEIFDVFGPDSLRTNPEVGLRLVRGVLTSEVKSFLEVSREVETVIKALNDIHQTASQYVKLNPSPPSRSPASRSPAEPSSPVQTSAVKKQIKVESAFKTPGFPVKTPSTLLKVIPESAELSSTKGSSSKLQPLQLPTPTTPSALHAMTSPVTPVMDFAATLTPKQDSRNSSPVTPVIDVAASARLRGLASPVSPVMDYAASSPVSRSPPRPEVSPNSKQRRTPPPEEVEEKKSSVLPIPVSVSAPTIAPSRPSEFPQKVAVPPTPPTEPNSSPSRPSSRPPSRPSSRPASPTGQSGQDADQGRKSVYNIRGRSGKSDESNESGSSATSLRRSGLTENMTAEEKEEYLRKKKERQDLLVSEALAAAEKEKAKEKDKDPEKANEPGPPVGRVRSLTSVEGDAPRPSLSIQTRRPSITGNRNSLRHTGSGTVASTSANITSRQSLGPGYGPGPSLMSPALTNRQSLRLSSSGTVVTPAKKRYSYTGGVISAADVMAGSALDGIGRRSEMTTPVTASSKSLSMAADDADNGDLPEGWKEHFDKATNRPFYVHKATKSRQWKRPTHANPEPATKKPPAAVRRNSSKSDVSDDSVTDRFSSLSMTDRNTFNMTDRRMTQFDAEPDRQTIVNMLTADLGAQLHGGAVGGAGAGSTVGLGGAMRATLARQKVETRENDAEWVANVKQMNLDAGEQNACLTVTKMEYLGSDNKSGYLMKKSSILGRLRKRWFVLEGSQFQYYERPQDEAAGNGKAFLLNPMSLTTYTTTPHCFCVKSSEDSDESSHWYLTAKDDADMESWIMAINARIHVMYAQEYGWLSRDLWEEGFVETTFWRVLKPSTAAQAGAISVRTLPKTNAPRTGETASAGEVLECVQTIKADFNTYLRLWGDRGWVYEKHSKARYAILGKVEGTFTEMTREYRYLGKGNLPILSGPGQENIILVVDAKSVIAANTVFTICARFTERLPNGTESDFTFYKLATGRGWICGQDKSGEAQIQWIV